LSDPRGLFGIGCGVRIISFAILFNRVNKHRVIHHLSYSSGYAVKFHGRDVGFIGENKYFKAMTFTGDFFLNG
jgi:hypothetical protein